MNEQFEKLVTQQKEQHEELLKQLAQLKLSHQMTQAVQLMKSDLSDIASKLRYNLPAWNK